MSDRDIALFSVALPARRVEELRRASNDLQTLDSGTARDVLAFADADSMRRSSTLIGCLGGVIGAGLGILVPGLAIGGAMLPAIVLGGPAGGFAGVAIALLAWRGPRRLLAERGIDQAKLILGELDGRIRSSATQIDALPTRAPQQIVDDLWHAHRRLVAQRAEAEAEIAEAVS